MRPVLTRFGPGLAVAVAVAALSGCGGEASEPSAGTPAGEQDQMQPQLPGAPDGAGLAELRDCLKKNGAELPNPSQGRRGPPSQMDESSRTAFEQCRHLLPDGAPPGGGAAPPGGSSEGAPQ